VHADLSNQVSEKFRSSRGAVNNLLTQKQQSYQLYLQYMFMILTRYSLKF